METAEDSECDKAMSIHLEEEIVEELNNMKPEVDLVSSRDWENLF